MVLIEINHLVKKYGEHVAVDDLTLTVEPGKIYGFLGPNGAGKSTTMNMITGYLGATSGEVKINGHDIFADPQEAKKCVGYLPEIPPLYTEMTVREYLDFVAELKGLDKKVRKTQTEEIMELTHTKEVSERLIRNLSKGYRQRVGFAQAVMGYPDVIILDLGLPDMDGMEILSRLRKWSGMPVVVISARSHEKDKVEALDLGADDYITKPFGTSEMLARIRAAIRHSRTGYQGPAGGMTGVFEAKDLLIDYDKHRAYKGGLDLNLTQNEFRLVSLLSRYAGKVLTYDFMIREIWGPNMENNNRILRVNMANIRRKLEKNPAQPEYIFTEIGVGYRMIEPEG